MQIYLNLSSQEDYQRFLRIKTLPSYRFSGKTAWFPDEYAERVTGVPIAEPKTRLYRPRKGLFDYQAGISRLAIRKRKFAVFAACVSGETVINSPDGDERIDVLAERGNPVRVWSLDSSGQRQIGTASSPWTNGFARLYRFTLRSGASIVATMGHRFLTSSGWCLGEHLRIGESLAVSASNHLLSTREPDRRLCREGDRRSIRTTPGYRESCLQDCHPCDGRLPQVQGSGRSSSPLQGDARGHTRPLSAVDALERTQGHSHRYQRIYRPSMPGFDYPAWNEMGGVVCSPLSSGPSCTHESIHTCSTIPGYTILVRQGHEFIPSVGQQFSDGLCEPCDFSFDTLVRVQYIRDDWFFDLEVPEFGNYSANGIWSHNCGLGKTFIQSEFARHAAAVLPKSKCVLMIAPLMVVEQTMDEVNRFYGGKFPLVQLRSNKVNDWIVSGKERIGITNWESLTDEIPQGRIGALVPDESAYLKGAYGKWGTNLIRIGRGVDWKLCSTGVPAPNDRIEYANHAVFLDAFPTINSFYSRFFVNRGETSERWELKPHALRPFYRALSHWCIFMSNPATYGWKDNSGTLPPINVHIHDVDLTREQEEMVRFQTGCLFATRIGGITTRSKLSQIAKGQSNGEAIETLKPAYIRELVGTWPEESTIIWCRYNAEQERLEREFPGCASIAGSTKYEDRKVLIDDFKAGRRKVLLSKPRVLGFGLNLQRATRQVFSSCEDSFEEYHQAVKRSNRVGSTLPLNVHIVVTEVERPMMENVLRKADRVQVDEEEQEKLFLECGYDSVL